MNIQNISIPLSAFWLDVMYQETMDCDATFWAFTHETEGLWWPTKDHGLQPEQPKKQDVAHGYARGNGDEAPSIP